MAAKAVRDGGGGGGTPEGTVADASFLHLGPYDHIPLCKYDYNIHEPMLRKRKVKKNQLFDMKRVPSG